MNISALIFIILNVMTLPVFAHTLSEDKRVKELKEVWKGNKTIDYETVEKNELNTRNELLGINTEKNVTSIEIEKKNQADNTLNTNYDKFQSSSEFNIVDEDPHAANIVLGEKLWKQHCSRCHNLRSTKDFDTDEWRAIMAHMKVRACLPDELARIILEYIIYSASPPSTYSTSFETSTVEYKTFSENENKNESNDRKRDTSESKKETNEVKETNVTVENKETNSTDEKSKTKTKEQTITIKKESVEKEKLEPQSKGGLPGPPP